MARILLVGEERERVTGIRSLLRQDSHDVTWTRAVPRWLEVEHQVRPEVVVATVREIAVLLQGRAQTARAFPAPLLLVHDDDLPRETDLDERLVDRLQSPFDVQDLLGRVDALVRLRRLILRGQPEGDPGAPSRSGRFLGRIKAAMATRVPRIPKPTAPYLEVVNRVAEWTDRRDMFEPGHAERVTSLVAMMADELRLPDSDASPLLRAAMLHDIGKVVLPSELLREQGPLREEQVRLIRTHPERGAALLRALDPEDKVVANTIRYHHEHIDGSGYYGRDGENIPRSARILVVAETYDAMTTSKVRERIAPDRALSILEEQRGSAFEAECVDALVSALRPRPTVVPLSPLGFPFRDPCSPDASER